MYPGEENLVPFPGCITLAQDGVALGLDLV